MQFSANDVEALLRKSDLDKLVKLAEGEECEHQDMEEGHCLDCGLDRTEELSALAYDRAKDFRKYGDDA